jgi:phosphopantothenate-cysteine ligase
MVERRIRGFIQSLYSFIHRTSATLIHSQLETDEDLLIPKARAALERYGHQVVIANELHSRKHRVLFVSKRSQTTSHDRPDAKIPKLEYDESWLLLDGALSPTTGRPKEIEEDIVAELVKRHTDWIEHTA